MVDKITANLAGSKPAEWIFKPWVRWAMYGLILAWYLVNRSPFVHFHDSLGFLADAMEGFQPGTNATAHFLFNNLQHILVEVFSFADPVLVLSIFVIVYSMLTLYLLEYWIREMTGNELFAMIGVLIMAFSFTWWQQTEIIEVYTFNAFIYMLYVVPAFLDIRDGHRGRLLRVAFFFGLAHLVHIQHILSWPFFLFYVWTGKKETIFDYLQSFIPVFGILTLLLVQRFYPTNTISAIFFDSQFQSDIVGIDIVGWAKGLGMAFGFLAYNFHIWLLLLAVGIIHLWKHRDRGMFWPLAILSAPYFAFGSKFNVPDAHVFFLLAWLPFVVVMAFGMEAWKKMVNRMAFAVLLFGLCGSSVAYGLTAAVAKRLPMFAEYHEAKAYKGGVLHMFWPGKLHANDPLALTKQWAAVPNSTDSLPEWNYCGAIRVLQLKGEWGADWRVPEDCD